MKRGDDALFRAKREVSGLFAQAALDADRADRQIALMADTEPTLDDAEYSLFVWRRFRGMLKWMALASVITAAVAVAWVHYYGGGLTLAVTLATALGVGLTVFMAAALMGLVFLSSGSGHDEAVNAQGKKSLTQHDRRD